MSQFITKVNSVSIQVSPHNGIRYPRTTTSNAILGTSKISVNDEIILKDGDSATWTCPICGSINKVKIIGNSKITSNDFKVCVTGAQLVSDPHYASIIGSDIKYCNTIEIN